MKDSPPRNLKTLFGPMRIRRAGEQCSGPCASRSPGARNLLTPSLFPACWAKKKPSTALPKHSKNYKIKGMRCSLFVFALLLALVVPAFLPAQALADEATTTPPDPNAEVQAQLDATNAQIQKLKEEIAALQKDLTSTTAQKQTLQNAIKALDLQIQKLQKSVTLTSTQISQKDKEIGTISGDIRTTEQKISDAQTGIAVSLRRLEQADREEPAVALFSGETLSSFFDEAVNLGSLRNELQKRQELAKLKTNLTQQKQGITVAKAGQTTLLNETKNKESSYQALIAQKKAEESAFEAELVRLAAGLGAAGTSSAPSAAKGILSWPLDSVTITQHFGNTSFAQSGAYSGNGHNGIDFRAAIGTPVHAALAGVVQEINQGAVKNCQYGKWVLVKHDNGLTSLYAHLSNIAVAKWQRAGTGELVGYAGDTGYATGPHLHFTLYISSAVTFKQYTCNSGRTSYIPIAPLNAYLNPLSYLPVR